jgi:hypothetical protein
MRAGVLLYLRAAFLPPPACARVASIIGTSPARRASASCCLALGSRRNLSISQKIGVGSFFSVRIASMSSMRSGRSSYSPDSRFVRSVGETSHAAAAVQPATPAIDGVQEGVAPAREALADARLEVEGELLHRQPPSIPVDGS